MAEDEEIDNLTTELQNNTLNVEDAEVMKVRANPPRYLPKPAGKNIYDKAQYIRNIPEEQRKPHQKEWLRLYDENRSNYYIDRYNEYETQYDASLLSPIDSTLKYQVHMAIEIRRKQEYGFESITEKEFLARYNEKRNCPEFAIKHENYWKAWKGRDHARPETVDFVPIPSQSKFWAAILRRGFAMNKFIQNDFRAKYYGCIIEKSSEEQKDIMKKWLEDYDGDAIEDEDEDMNEEGHND